MAKNFKKFLILPVFCAVCFAFASVGAKTSAQSTKSSKVSVSGVQTEMEANKLLSEMISTSFTDLGMPKADEFVSAIVTLKGTSLVDSFKKANYVGSISDYLVSDDAIAQSKLISSEQELVKARIKNAMDVEFQYTYNTIQNGFGVKIQYKDLAKLKSVEGVKDVQLAVYYNLPEDEEAEEVEVNIATLTGAKSSSAYRGQGMVIGVLDTGLQTSHEAFSVTPNGAKLDSSSFSDILSSAAASFYYQANGLFLSSEDTYVSAKVPFAYDYADNDLDVNPNLKTIASTGNDHGTHVAGIAAGNNGKGFEGSAPDAQLAIFKVFSDKGGGATSLAISAALNDAILLGVDVVNMSLGSSYGFSDISPEYAYSTFVRELDEAGISLVCSAGNSYMAGIGSNYSYGTIYTPDQGTISSPSSLYPSLSVASFDTENEKAPAIEIGGVPCIYNDCVINQTTSEKTDFVALICGDQESVEFEWIYAGLGTADDFAKIDATGKVALIKRGDLTFAEKAQNALDAGAVAVIIFNNVGGSRFNPVVEGVDIPVCAISLEDGQKIVASSIKTCHFGAGVYIYGGTMSLFSSWGPTPSLELKPEITSYGGKVYSSLPNETGDAYGMMSGTSMSSPNMAGNVAVVRQSLDNRFLSVRESLDVSATAYRLLMSTATPIVNRDNNVLYSPRRQGAGLVNVDAAISTPAYLYVRGEQKTKIELGDDPDCTGVYNLSFVLANMSNNELSYRLNPKVLTTTINSTDPIQLDGVSSEITDSLYYYSVVGQGSISGNTVTVKPNAEVSINVKVVLSKSTRDSLSSSYPYGTYVEGYVFATSTGSQCDLNIPFLGYYGDFDRAPMFDSTAYDNIEPYVYDSVLVGVLGGYYAFPLGHYLYEVPAGYAEPTPSQDLCYIAPYNSNAISTLYSIYMGLLRNANYLSYEFFDARTGELLESIYGLYVPKAHVNDNTGAIAGAAHALNWIEIYANNTQFEIVVTAHNAYDNPYENAKYQIKFKLGIDFEAPQFIGAEATAEEVLNGIEPNGAFTFSESDGRKYIEFDVQDNGALQSYCLYDSAQNSLTGHIPFYSKSGETVHVKHDITDYVDTLEDNKIIVYVDDYALNSKAYIITLPLHEVESLDFESESYEIAINETFDILNEVIVTPENGYIISDSLKLESSDSEVVKVNENYTITGLKAGTSTISFSLQTVNNQVLTASCTVVVTEEEAETIEVTSVTVAPATHTVKAGESFTLTATIAPAAATDQSLVWASSKPELATVDQTGKVTALKSGTVEITATSANGVSGKCTVTITENAGDFKIIAGVLSDYTGNGGAIVIPDGVKEIAKDAFRTDKTITSVVIPASCTKIGDYAFYQCTKLTSVTFLCEGDYSIGAYTFSGCSALTEVTFSDGLKSVGNRAFQSCSKLTAAHLPASVESLGTYVFYSCAKLADVTYPATLTSVPDGTFRGSAITSFTVSASVTSIGTYAFENCKSLTSLTFADRTQPLSFGNYAFSACAFPNAELAAFDVKFGTYVFANNKALVKASLPQTLTEIPQGIYSNCTSLADISYCPNPTKIGSYAFAGTAITEFVVPACVTDFGVSMFKDCTKLEKVTILCEMPKVLNSTFAGCVALKEVVLPDDYTVIQTGAFQDCKSLTSFVIPEGVTQIDTNAFSGCSGLTEITLPSTFTTGANSIFKGCTSLEKVYLNSKSEVKWQAGTTASYKAFSGIANLEIIAGEGSYYASSNDGIIYTAGYKGIAYVFDAPTCIVDKVLTIRDEVEFISLRAFASSTITGVQLSANLKEIGDYAFSASKLTSVTIPASVEKICEYAFYNCTSLTEVNFAADGNLEVLERAAFSTCGLTSVVLPDSLVRIEDGVTTSGVFVGNKLTSVTFGKNLEYIGNYAFDCSSTSKYTNQLTVVDLSQTKVKTIGNYAFRNQPLAEVKLSNYVETIGDYAFYSGAYNISNSSYAGHNVTAEYIVFPETLKSIGKYAFMGWCMLREVILPDSVESLADSSFRICVSIEKLKLSASMTEIPTYSFSYLGYNYKTYNPNWESYNLLTELYIPAGIQEIANTAFATSTLIEKVVVDPANEYFRSESGMLYSTDNQLIYVPPKLKALEEFVIPSFITELSTSVFGSAGFKNINAKKLYIPATVKKIGSLTFSGSKFEEIIFEDGGSVVLSSSVFANSKALKRVVLPEGLVGLPTTSFQGCTALEEVVFPSTLKVIANLAFSKCESLTSISIPDSVIQMYYGAFSECINLESVTLPSSLQEIAGFGTHVNSNGNTPRMFEGCPKLTSIEISEDNDFFKTVDGVLFNKDMTMLYEYPQGKTATEYVVPEGVVNIKLRAFRDNKSLQSVVLPTTLKVVGDYAFYGCDALTEVTFLSAVAPTLEQTQCVIQDSTPTHQGYCNFVRSNLHIETVYTVINGTNYVSVEFYYDPLTELTMNFPEVSKGYDSWAYSMLFATKEAFSVAEVTEINDLAVSKEDSDISLSWTGSSLGATYTVSAFYPGLGWVVVGTTMDTNFVVEDGVRFGGELQYRVVGSAPTAKGAVDGVEAEASITCVATGDAKAVVEVAKEVDALAEVPSKDVLVKLNAKVNALGADAAKVYNIYTFVAAYSKLEAALSYDKQVSTIKRSENISSALVQIKSLKNDYDSLSSVVKSYVEKYDDVVAWEKEVEAARQFALVLAFYDDADITEADGAKIDELNATYKSFNDYQVKLTKSLYDEKMGNIQAKYLEAVEEIRARNVQLVVELINSLSVTPTQADKASIQSARKAYDGLSDVEKASIAPHLVERLEACEKYVSEITSSGCTVAIGTAFVSALTSLSFIALLFKKREF